MDRLTTTTRLLENSRSTIYTSGHSTGRGTRGRPWIWITYFYSEKQWKLQCKLISPERVQYIHKSKYSIFFCYQFLHNFLHFNYKWQRNGQSSDKEKNLELPQNDSKLSLSLLLLRIRKLSVAVFTRCMQQSKHVAVCLTCCMTKPNLTTAQIILRRLLSHCCYVTSWRGCWCVTAYSLCAWLDFFFINKPTNTHILRCRCGCHVTLYASCKLNSLRLQQRVKYNVPLTSLMDAVQFVYSSDWEEPVTSLGAHWQRPTIKKKNTRTQTILPTTPTIVMVENTLTTL